MDSDMINRINALSRIAKERALTKEEEDERFRLRKAYLADFRQGFRNQLDATVVQYDDGSRVPLRDALKKPK